jgi:hypothetical protein
MRVVEAADGLACLIQVWEANGRIPTGYRKTGGRRAGCRIDLLAVIRDAGRALSRKELVKALRDAKKAHGAGTVAKALAELTASGKLVNPKDKKGYRLAAWARRSRTPNLFDAGE